MPEALSPRYHCSYCAREGSGTDLQLCARCRAERYCSKECQTRHWKVHKQNCRPSKERLYAIEPIEGKGQGMISKRKIPKGTRILSETAIFQIHRDAVGLPSPDADTLTALERLSDSQRRAFYALYNCHGEHISVVQGIILTNNLSLGPNAPMVGIFLEASRINHSCKSNAEGTWNNNLNQFTVHARRDIKEGEEVCISYFGYLGGYAARQEVLRVHLGFQCGCDLCMLPPLERQRSDERLNEILTLDTRFQNRRSITERAIPRLHQTHRVLELLREDNPPGVSDTRISLMYYEAFQIAIANSDQARAKVFAERAYEERLILEGMDGSETMMFKSLAQNPSEYPLHGISMQWMQGVSSIPRNKSESEFEAWLWMKS
ncbi:SET domain-containing protein [Corynespora cassiicola Philippines]|uniref:SET domain-containing protein n=1 Tax=Corynespora cassiicola Philippines TaxID=1448308 RepID=A0A2T2N344_CORCC|nr:SET domain-containing protein [Corynespora cassiicola Philippines]